MALRCFGYFRPELYFKELYIWNTTKRLMTSGTSQKSSTTTSSPPKSPSKDIGNVPGLSAAVVSVPSSEVGPGASKQGEYKNPEYFSYNVMSYHQAEVEMLKYRLPQPSSNKPLKK